MYRKQTFFVYVLFTIIWTLFTGCAHEQSAQVTVARDLASKDTLKKTISELYLAAVLKQNFVKKFDLDLKRGADPMKSKNYRKILALREHSAALEDEVEENYSHYEPIINGIKDGTENLGLPDSSNSAWYWLQRFWGPGAFSEKQKRSLAKLRAHKGAALSNLEAKIDVLAEQYVIPDEDPPVKRFEPSLDKRGNVSGFEYPPNYWSLTFDDGPHEKNTMPILNLLETEGIYASFFMLGKQVKKYPNIGLTIKNAGMDIGAHTWSHPNLEKHINKLNFQVETSKAFINKSLSLSIKLFRLPYGAGFKDPVIRQKILAENLIHVLWNVDSLDWDDPEEDSIVERTIAQIKRKKRGIILMHDIQPHTLGAAKRVLDHLMDNGKILCDVQAMIDKINGDQSRCE